MNTANTTDHTGKAVGVDRADDRVDERRAICARADRLTANARSINVRTHDGCAYLNHVEPPQPPTESATLVPLPLELAAETRRLSNDVELDESHDSVLDEFGVANAAEARH